MSYTIGLDFGTESARAVLVNVATGETVTTAVEPFPDGVIDEALPSSGQPLPPDWALQNSADWLSAMEKAVKQVLADGDVSAQEVVGLGLDFTACTVLPTDAAGTPLHRLDIHRAEPHAWVKLWKHHGAQSQADRVNTLAAERGERWLARYGGKVSSEWLIPKALEMLEQAPVVYDAAAHIVEGADWLVWQLTGQWVRDACTAGYKGFWHKTEGEVSADFLAALNPRLANLYSDKVTAPVVAPGTRVGGLQAEWANRLGLAVGMPVAAPIIDAHAGVLGAGVTGPGVMFMIMGTSTCQLLMGEREVPAEGIAGIVEDGIVPGLVGYEAGQAGAGDMFAWLVRHAVPPAYHQEAEQRRLSLYDLLAEKSAGQWPGQHGLLVLDWWNGNRSTLMDSDLSGLLVGATLGTRAEDIYRAMVESTAFGTRVIIEAFTGQGLAVGSIVAAGGQAQSPLVMQLYADITGREIHIAGTDQASALGAAMLGAVAAGSAAGGYDSLAEAAVRMAPPPAAVYKPIAGNVEPYNRLYAEYTRLYDYFGRGENKVMKALRTLQRG